MLHWFEASRTVLSVATLKRNPSATVRSFRSDCAFSSGNNVLPNVRGPFSAAMRVTAASSLAISFLQFVAICPDVRFQFTATANDASARRTFKMRLLYAVCRLIIALLRRKHLLCRNSVKCNKCGIMKKHQKKGRSPKTAALLLRKGMLRSRTAAGNRDDLLRSRLERHVACAAGQRTRCDDDSRRRRRSGRTR